MKLTKKLYRELEIQAMHNQTIEEIQGVKDTIALMTDHFRKANSKEWEELFMELGIIQEMKKDGAWEVQ